jgi:hypothetical protein
MYDSGKVLIGLAVFLAIVSFPLWYHAATGQTNTALDLVLPEDPENSEACIKDTTYMRNSHMELLDLWRDLVVRENVRYFEDDQGVEREMSLSHTCLACHSNKDTFCDRCHDYLGVAPYCWDCHVTPELLATKEAE